MEWHDIVVDGRHTVKFSDLPYVPLTSPPQSPEAGESFVGKKLGGILRHGEWAWLARNSVLHIVSLRNGQTISSYEFCESRGYESCCIKCVEEILPNNPEVMLLAVVLESFRGPGGGCSYVAVYSIELSSVLNTIELSLHLTCARFMNSSACRHSLLQNFDGCLALGSEEGVIVLLNLNMGKYTSMNSELQEDHFVSCQIDDYSLSLTEIHRNFRQCQQDGTHFGLQMEVIESPCSVQCVLPIDLILGLGIGLEDGRLALYDLAELQIFYIALPSSEVTMSPLVKMDFLEPSDDPRPCLYIWTLHENGENLHAVLHSLMYEKRLMEEHESLTYFESFQTSSVRLQLPLEATKSVALSCQAISTLPTHSEDDSNCLCVISWLSVLEEKNKLLIFDLNQWYKEEMPFVLEYGKQPSYLAGYILNGECTGLQTLLNPNSIAHFNSMQRFEEHFYPNSLSFEALLLHTEGSRRYNWEGVQNRVINLLRSSNAAIFLEPNLYFNEIMRTRLMPQFMELNMNSTFSRNAKYEILLSAALEHNCISLLRDCAKSWIDGSFMGNFAAATGLSLSTLTDWMWKRANCIKSRCNDLCKCLFEFDGYPLDSREQKELAFITRQLKLLTDLMKEILLYAKKQIPERVFNDLENKHCSLCMASSYQNILLWLLNIGLLPEASAHNNKINAGNDLILYPHKELQEFYRNKRAFFAKISETSLVSKKSGSCKLLFIDSFIEHVCKGNILYEYWLENEGDGLYPPNSLEAMLRIMLVPDLDYENKCAILLYFFLDLNMAIDEQAYKDVVANFIKFPSVFKLSAPLIKTVQAFWNLDHDHYLAAVDEFISPFNKNQSYPQWQVELFIEVLLNQKASNLALRILESQPSLISPLLRLNTLLTNDLISEAFHFVRSKNDEELLETFFARCLGKGQFGVIRDLALTEREGLILQSILKKSKAQNAESLHFVYLLQKSKYIEAVSYMEELSNKTKSIKSSLRQNSEMDTPNLVLSAFNTTMTPVTQGLTDVYFRIKNKIKKKEIDNKSPVPLSCQLTKQNANNLLGGIYHSSALSAHFATYYWGEMEEHTKQAKHLLNSNNAPFLRRPQVDTNCINYLGKNNISYPQAYKHTEKRNLLESGMMDNENDVFERQKIEHKLNPKKKRRLIGQEIVDDLTNFMKMKKTLNNLNASEFTFGQLQTSESATTKTANAQDLLITPVRRGKDLEDVVAATPKHEIHGILKTHTPEPGQLLTREPLAEEEKCLRFTLPSVEVSPCAVNVKANQNNDAIEHMETCEELNAPEVSRKYDMAKKSKQITRAVSEESSHRSSTNSSNASEENFYSPLSSQNNSKLDCSNLSSYSFLSGPQPRKPLARLSAERSDKSLTPESDTTKAANSSCINKSSRSEYATALDSSIKSKISARSSLERRSTERLEKTDERKESSNADYVTAIETISKSKIYSSANSKAGVTQTQTTTSGVGSISSHTTFAGSKIDEFLPKNSSSKVSASPIKVVEDNKTPYPAKLSECSTVLSSLTTFECSNTISTIMPLDKTKPSKDLDKPTEEQKRQMLETTLTMSTYDISILDSTSLQQTKLSLNVTANDFTFKPEKKKITEFTEQNNKDCNLRPEHKEETNEDLIVLSSSSSLSSTASSSSLEQEQDEDNYNESERDEEDEQEMEDEDIIDNDDTIEGDAFFEYDEDNDSDSFNEDDGNDYEQESNNEELSILETDNSIGTDDNDDDIQLIEDSSSDVRQPQANYYGESDSDDVKVIEYDEQPTLANDNISVLPVSKVEGEEKREDASNIGIDVKAERIEDEDEVEINAPTLEANSQNSEQLVSCGGDQEDQKLDLRENKHKDTESVPKEAQTAEIKVKSSIGEKYETTEQAPVSLKKDDLMDDSEGKTQTEKTEEDKAANEKTEIETMSEQNEESVELKLKTIEDDSGHEKDSRKATKETSVPSIDLEPKPVEIKSTAEEEEEEQADKAEETSKLINENKICEENVKEEEDIKLKEMKDHSTSSISKPPKQRSLRRISVDATVTTPRKGKFLRGSSAPPTEIGEEDAIKQELKAKQMDEGKQSATKRGTSIPPMDPELGTVEIESTKNKTNDEREVKEEFKVKQIDDDSASTATPKRSLRGTNVEAGASTPRRGKFLRGSSVPPVDLEFNSVAAAASPRRNKRGISVPPQSIIETEELTNLTPRTRRSIRASSLQPKSQIENIIEEATPRKIQKTQDSVDNKITTRRRSALLEAINEDSTALDSPSTRTRSRLHLNSIDSEPDSSLASSTEQLVQPKRILYNQPVESPVTPKRTRRKSILSQPETSAALLTPRSLRGRSVQSVQEEDTESIPASPKPASIKRIGIKRKKSTNEQQTSEGEKQTEQISPTSDQSAVSSEFSYSSARRLTRTQMAVMEKSAALIKASAKDAIAKEADTISPPQNKRSVKSRSTRSSLVTADSDDAESVSSKLSTVSSANGTGGRRVTRQSVKDKDETDDDVSVASSFGSEKHHQKFYRSKDKSSPLNISLAAIPEDAPVEPKKRGRPPKH